MKPLMARLLFLAALGLAASAPTASAEAIDFSYSWTVLPGTVFPSGTGSVIITPVPAGTSSAELNSSALTFIPGAEVTTTSSASSPIETASVDTFNTPFHLKLTLKDTASGEAGDLLFSGTLSGTLTATESTLTSTFHNPLTQPLTLGGHVFSVTIDPTLANLPSPTGSSTPVLINGQVTVSGVPVVDPPPVLETPEPASLVLGATALAGLAMLRRWRK